MPEYEKWFQKAMDNIGTKRIGKSISFFKEVDSTNAQATRQAKNGAGDGTILLAEVQNAGYGRMNRHWTSPKGGLWLSIILRPDIVPKHATIITLMGACSVAEALKSTHGMEAKIKWPNDVLISGKKVCGIMTEMRTRGNEIDYVILGLGINVNFPVTDLPQDIRETATTLQRECEKDVSTRKLFKTLILELDDMYDKLLSRQSGFILDSWRGKSDTLGQQVRVVTIKESIEGNAVDIDESGALIVRTEDGKMRNIIAGDCVHLERKQ